MKTRLAHLLLILSLTIAAVAQPAEQFDRKAKLYFHAKSTFAPLAIVGAAVSAGIRQEADAPTEWGQGAAGYGKRFGSTLAASGIRSALALGLDSTLHQDPRYVRSGGGGFWRRSGRALRGTLLTRTDDGGETVSSWRIGSAYGAAFLSNQWYPSRLNTARLGFIQGSVTLGFDVLDNLVAEFLPDLKRKVLRRK